MWSISFKNGTVHVRCSDSRNMFTMTGVSSTDPVRNNDLVQLLPVSIMNMIVDTRFPQYLPNGTNATLGSRFKQKRFGQSS